MQWMDFMTCKLYLNKAVFKTIRSHGRQRKSGEMFQIKGD